jgi:hypothetical protein
MSIAETPVWGGGALWGDGTLWGQSQQEQEQGGTKMKHFSIVVNIGVPDTYEAGEVNAAAQPICDQIRTAIQANPAISFKGGKVDWTSLPDPTWEMIPE